MTNIGFRLVLVVLFTTITSLITCAQSNFNGPVYEVKVTGLEEPADIKILVTLIRNSVEVDYCRFAQDQNTLVIQTRKAMSYGEIDALISETGFSLRGDVVTAKGVRMHSNGEVSQPAQNQ